MLIRLGGWDGGMGPGFCFCFCYYCCFFFLSDERLEGAVVS